MTNLQREMQSDLLRRGYSRRSFGRIAAILTAGAALPFYNEAALAKKAAQQAQAQGFSFPTEIPPGAARINGNENPMGPSPEALDAIQSVLRASGYYSFSETLDLARAVAETEGLKVEEVIPFGGSSDPLHRAVLAYCSPKRSFVVADPGYEAGSESAAYIGAKVIRVPLTKTYAHDVKAMVKADPNAGVIYICNPNNPSGTTTPKADIEWALANKPAGSLLLLDEAYLHISKEWENRATDLVAAGKDLLILRTFSKLYGMAGLRVGLAMARPDILARLSSGISYETPGKPGMSSLLVTVPSAAGAAASVRSKTLIPERRKIIADIREDVFSFLEKRHVSYIRSDTNFFMMDVKRPPQEFARAMAKEKVLVGRSWPVWPTYSRITVGSKGEMEMFKNALQKVMA